MEAAERYQLGNLVIAAVATGHALYTWPVTATLSLFGGGAVLALLAELLVVRTGLVDHAITPQVAGVPVSIVLVWPAIVYICLQLALLVLPSEPAAAGLAALVGTAFDVATEPFGLARGVWHYPQHPFSNPRLAGIPWWNVAGWFVMVFSLASLPLLVGL